MAKISPIHQRILDSKAGKEAIKNDFWDAAKLHYEKCMNAIEQVEGQLLSTLKELINNPTKLAIVNDQMGLANNINILANDIKLHINRLNVIYAQHCNKSGGTKTADEHMQLLHIHGLYSEALEIYDVNIIPTITHILEQIGAADALVEAELNKAIVPDTVVPESKGIYEAMQEELISYNPKTN